MSPDTFPLPTSISYFGKPPNEHPFFILERGTGRRSKLDILINDIWSDVSETRRDLMLYCWAAQQKVKVRRNTVAHPTLDASTAKGILQADFGGVTGGLYDDACALIDEVFGLYPLV